MISFWEQETFYKKQDIIIIGSGFVGLWSAIALAKKNKNLAITVVDKGVVPTGASTKNAGFSCFGSPTELIADNALYGETNMLETVEKRYKGMLKINATFKANIINYDACGGYECLQANDTNVVMGKIDALNLLLKSITNSSNTFTFNNSLLQQFGLSNFNGLVQNKLEGSLHPAKLIIALRTYAVQLGVQFLNGINIKNYFANSEVVTIEAENNITFKTTQLLICTNGLANKLLPHTNVTPNRGQVFITTPINGFNLKGCFHYNCGYYYFRNVGNRLLIGGARNTNFNEEQTDKFNTTEGVLTELINFTKTHILNTQAFDIETAWSGIMGFTANKLPEVKSVEHNVFCAVGMNGIGVAIAPIIGEEIADLMAR